MHLKSTLKALPDRTLNRLIVGAIAFLVVGTLVVGAIYVSDRWVDRGPTMVERRIQDLEAALKANPNAIGTRLQLVGAYVTAGRDPDALIQLDEVLKVQPDSKTAHLARGDVLRRQGNLDGAVKDYQAIVDLVKGTEFAAEDTELQEAYYDLGAIALERKKPVDAIPLLTESLKIDGTNADTLNLLGTAYLQANQPDKAADSLRKAVSFVPTGWCDPYITLGQAYTGLGKTAEAEWAGAMVDFCQARPAVAKGRLAALVGGTAATDALVGLGMIAEAESDRAAAADYYAKALARDPQNFHAQSGLSRVTDPSVTPLPSPLSPTSRTTFDRKA
jgi:tetratricopeptide (TPR) repeat protein